jgi:hypothetical protein
MYFNTPKKMKRSIRGIFLFLVMTPILTNARVNYEEKVMALLNLKPENYIKEIQGHRKALDTYLLKKSSLCKGEFSSLILGDEENSEKKKMTKAERKVCLGQVNKLRQQYINNLFLARKRYLEYLHKKRIQNLIEEKQKILKSLNSLN